MNKSFFTERKDSDLASGSNNFSTKISASPTSYGLSASQATAYAALNTAWQAAYQTAITPSTRTKSTVAAKNASRAPLRVMASNLAKIIDGTPTVTDAQKIDLGIAVRATPSPMPPPGTPYQFEAALGSDGSVTLTWKCNNPKGSAGTMYQVYRRIGTATEFDYLGGTGTKTFPDATIPAGTSRVTYLVQAARSTAVGAGAQFNVSFGTSGGAPVVEDVAESSEPTPKMRRAA